MRRSDLEIGVVPCFRIPLIKDDKDIGDKRLWITYKALKQGSLDFSVKYIRPDLAVQRRV